jgi:alkanesulfonate monooxygenase SsuD/methylene tetrahydromethanopterin reductase-like flavin-dependent oxidoreductase (luciferase family)
MKLSTFMMPIHPPGRNLTETFNEDREAVIWADHLGFSEAYVGEHVTDAAETITNSMIFLSSLIYDTKRIMLGTGTINLPNSHPAAIAAQAAMMDHMLEGRFIMGISPGGLMSDAEVFGNYKTDRNAMFVEAINTILQIWDGEAPYNINGEYWKISTENTMIPDIGQGYIMKPYQKPHPLIVGTAVAPFSKGVTEMAKRGWQPISANFLMPEWVKTHWPKYVEGRESIGEVAKPSEWRVAKSIFVADDEATAQEYGRGENGPYYAYFKSLSRKLLNGGRGNLFKVDPNMPDADVTPEYVTNRLVIAGNVNSVVDQLLAFREHVGDFGNLLYACHDWKNIPLAKRSMELMAKEVMPRLNEAIGETADNPVIA